MLVRESEERTLIVGWWWEPFGYAVMTVLMLSLPLIFGAPAWMRWVLTYGSIAMLLAGLPGWYSIQVDDHGVELARGWGYVPTWKKRIGLDCRLDRYWSWDGPDDDGIAFTERDPYDLHRFGSVRTCERLYAPLRRALTRHRAHMGLPIEDGDQSP